MGVQEDNMVGIAGDGNEAERRACRFMLIFRFVSSLFCYAKGTE